MQRAGIGRPRAHVTATGGPWRAARNTLAAARVATAGCATTVFSAAIRVCARTRARAGANRVSRKMLALATLAVLGGLPGVASAGEYHVYSCRTPGGAVAPTDGWSEGGHSGEDTTLNTCSSGGGLVAGMNDGFAHSAYSESDKASWTFQTPAHETIVAGSIMRAGATSGGSNQHAYYAAYMESTLGSGEKEAFDVCTAWQPCTTEGESNEPLASNNLVALPESVLPSSRIALIAACGSAILGYACPEGKNDPSGYAATVELFAADMVLSQTEPPTVSRVEGDLAEAPTVSGTSDVAFEASDTGSGIYEVVFRVDGQVVSTVVPEEEGGRCHDVGGTTDGLPAFLYTQPCPAAVSVDLPFDTTTLSNGTHHLVVSVLDAAGNSATVLDRQVAVDNASPGGSGKGSGTDEGEGAGSSGSGSQTSGSGTGSGTGGSGTGGSGSDGAGTGSTGGTSGGAGGSGGGGNAGSASPAASTATLGPANGTNASDEATLTASWRGHAGELLRSAYGAAHTIQGTLAAPGGVPIAGAQVEVQELPANAGAVPHALPALRTGAQGHWSLTLPRGISSAQLRIAYRSHVGAPLPVATRTLTLSVRAGLTLGIAPRLAAARGEIRFAGRVLGGPVPAGGKQLVLEARSAGGRWLEFHVIRAGAGGRFHFAYRFRLAGPISYQFRVLSEAEADYPFAAGSSNIVRVYER